MPYFSIVLSLVLFCNSVSSLGVPQGQRQTVNASNYRVIILGGGVTGVIAARTLHQNGIDNFVIVEARDEIGGRLMSYNFSGTTVELGANWVQGTQTDNGPANPIFTLTQKWNVSTPFNDLDGSVTTYDSTGNVDYRKVLDDGVNAFSSMVAYADTRTTNQLVDVNAKAAYSMAGSKPRSVYERAAEYYNFDFEYAQTPFQSSAGASAWNNDFTYDPSVGGFSPDNLLCVDQRGFKTFIQQEAKSFLNQTQVLLNSTVTRLLYTSNGVTVTLKDGTLITGDYVLTTFSLGVLQHDDVVFQPALPDWKQEAIDDMVMATYTKIFLKFPEKFWFDTEMGIYADTERGRYPVWQSLDHVNFLPGSRILFVTVTGDYSERIEALSDGQVKEEVMGVLRSMYPNAQIPDPVSFFFPRWLSDPLFRGSYSNWSPSFFRKHHDNLRANVGRVYFAGEYTSQKYYGFLHGAYFEGLDMGNTIVQCIKADQCSLLPHFPTIKNEGSYGLPGNV